MRRLPLKIITLLGDSFVFYREYKNTDLEIAALHDQLKAHVRIIPYCGRFILAGSRVFPVYYRETFPFQNRKQVLAGACSIQKFLATHYIISVSEGHPS